MKELTLYWQELTLVTMVQVILAAVVSYPLP